MALTVAWMLFITIECCNAKLPLLTALTLCDYCLQSNILKHCLLIRYLLQFHMCVADGSSHGVFFRNSNGMDFILNATSLTYR